MEIKNETKEKTDQKKFTDQFYRISKHLTPQISQFIMDNHIGLKPSLFYFASVIVELLKHIEDEKERDDMLKTLLLFMSEDKYGEI